MIEMSDFFKKELNDLKLEIRDVYKGLDPSVCITEEAGAIKGFIRCWELSENRVEYFKELYHSEVLEHHQTSELLSNQKIKTV